MLDSKLKCKWQKCGGSEKGSPAHISKAGLLGNLLPLLNLLNLLLG